MSTYRVRIKLPTVSRLEIVDVELNPADRLVLIAHLRDLYAAGRLSDFSVDEIDPKVPLTLAQARAWADHVAVPTRAR